jgi:AcrR family transcriptional regulator
MVLNVAGMVDGGAREQMIAAAERLAAERGLGAMSLREVQLASGQRNKSAASYHFGSREGLIEAVVATRMGPVNERRLALLAGFDPHPGGATVAQLVAVLVVPLAEHTIGRPGSRWARFLAQGMTDPALSTLVRRTFEGLSYLEVRTRLVEVLDHLPAERRERRVDHATGLMLLSLAATEARLDAEGATDLPLSGLPLSELVDDLVAMCVGVLTAPASVGDGSLVLAPATPHRE